MAEGKSAGQNGAPDPILGPLLERAAGMDEDLSTLQYVIGRAVGLHVPATIRPNYDSWAEDLERAAGHLARQQFGRAEGLLARWSLNSAVVQPDATGVWLQGRWLMLLGDSQRDQGRLVGPRSAHYWYGRAYAAFHRVNAERRAAQAELSLAVVTEMTGKVAAAAERYRSLAKDERLGPRDRARARLWVGTSLSKSRQQDDAIRAMSGAALTFDELDEPEDWAVAHQKIGLAQRAVGRLDDALHHIEMARRVGSDLTALQRVRLEAAHAHCLVSDPATRSEGLATFRRTEQLAKTYGLLHQLRSIETIRAQFA